MTTPVQEHSALQAIHQRRAVRSYRTDPVPESTIRTLLDAAVHAPTAMHQEPWGFVVIQNAALLKRYSDRAKEMFKDEAAKHRNLLRVPGVSPSDDHLATLLADPGFNIFYNAGTLIVICGRSKGSFVEADCWLAAENFMLAASALDLGTCCIGLAVSVFNAPDIKAELEIPADAIAVAPIIVGVPAGPTPVVPRKPPLILHWAR